MGHRTQQYILALLRVSVFLFYYVRLDSLVLLSQLISSENQFVFSGWGEREESTEKYDDIHIMQEINNH